MEQEGADITPESDEYQIALNLFRGSRNDLRAALTGSPGGQNVIKAGLSADVDFAARLNVFDAVGVIVHPAAEPPVVRASTI
jgi:phosphosulfolactate phosphohydrolase-like enzyme